MQEPTNSSLEIGVSCSLPPSPRVVQALLNVAWRHPSSERPRWLRSELGETSRPPREDVDLS